MANSRDEMFQQTQPDATQHPPVQSGDLLGQCYLLKDQIGVGGMGVVYEVTDTLLNRRVAIKVAKLGIDSDALLREARIMAAFHHPGLPVIYAMGHHRDLAYLVMEYLSGCTLHTYMKQAPRNLAEAETCQLLISIADTLHVLHEAHLVHRDLKPANVMLVPPDRVVLVDFGISDLDQYVGDSMAGSPRYMAPEIILGQVQPGMGYLADIYALGVIGYELLIGRVPFSGDNIAEVLMQTIDREPAHVRAVRPDVSAPLAALIMDMLAKNPLDRPALAIEVANHLRMLGSPVHSTS